MKINFQRYLLSKYLLDFNSLHLYSLSRLYSYMGTIQYPSKVLDLGGGVGSMFTYFTQDRLSFEFNYTIVDESKENILVIPQNVKNQSTEKGFNFEDLGNGKFQVSNGESICQLKTICSTTEEFVKTTGRSKNYDIVVASSYLDIVPVHETLRMISTVLKPRGILYLPFNYDGLTLFHPVVDQKLDDEIVALYNQSMDERRVNGLATGGSLTGRKLLDWLPAAGYEILVAGSSDWCLFPVNGNYRGDEGYFLECIIQFIEDSVTPLWNDRPEILENWLFTRRNQIADVKLSFMAHQLDYIAARLEEG
jgi:hypothetical protein